ncbi:5-formyltetrahydrofolate cyclo-ligase [uncultured Sphingomonas sp.]|uniref:5-formyltetrahydrofolate cyclo-ligase n=1 Tax=uncultured Sphingomonas sp. TaxID=158754 RepID=UPI0035CBF5A3
MTDKTDLRARMRVARLGFVPDRPVRVSGDFLARLRPGIVVASYRPMRGEADPAPLERVAISARCVLALPWVSTPIEPMRFLAWTDGEPLEPGQFGLEQPPAHAPDLAPDIILTPLLAFDRLGGRLGQGMGYYDRSFTLHATSWRVGVAWSVQEAPRIPVDPWDVPLHAVATEKEWITV